LLIAHSYFLFRSLFFFISVLSADDVGIVQVCSVLETLSQLFPPQIPSLFLPTLQFIIKSFLDLAQYQSMTHAQQDAAQSHVQNDQVLASFACIIGRLAFQNYEGLMQAIKQMANGQDSQVICTLIDGLVSKVNKKLFISSTRCFD
jgi:hypothetical protein